MIAQRVPNMSQEDEVIDVLKDTREYIDNKEVEERLLSDAEFEKESGKSVEEMYREDLKRREEDELDYDDTVTGNDFAFSRSIFRNYFNSWCYLNIKLIITKQAFSKLHI